MWLRTPNQQCTLNKLLTELRCRNFVTMHRRSIRICGKRAKTCMQGVLYYIPNELPFLHTTVDGWAGI